MSEQFDKARASSSSSLNSSLQDAEDEKTIANILSEEQVKDDRRLGKRLSHLDSIPVRRASLLSFIYVSLSLRNINVLVFFSNVENSYGLAFK